MTITGAVVLYATIWFLTLYVMLPLRRRKTQGEAGEIVPGTPAGAPAREEMGRMVRDTTLAATLVWAVVAGVIWSGRISLADIDFLNALGRDGGAGQGTD